MVGADESAPLETQPLFEAMGKRVFTWARPARSNTACDDLQIALICEGSRGADTSDEVRRRHRSIDSAGQASMVRSELLTTKRRSS
jgi:hypothetical protein